MTNLKIELDKRGLTHKWLAEQVGVTEAAISRYINGERVPKAPLAIKIARTIGLSVEDLFDASSDPYAGFEPYIAEPITDKPLIMNINNPTLVAWFRCNSCYTCLWRKVVIDNDPDHDIHWCARTHDRANIVDMVRYLGYSKE